MEPPIASPINFINFIKKPRKFISEWLDFHHAKLQPLVDFMTKFRRAHLLYSNKQQNK